MRVRVVFLLLALAFVPSLASLAFAEPPQQLNEFFIGIGTPRQPLRCAAPGSNDDDWLWEIVTGNIVVTGTYQGGPSFTLGYERWLNRWAAVGISGTTVGASRSVTFRDAAFPDETARVTTVLLDMRAYWSRFKFFQAYSRLAFGVYFRSDSNVLDPRSAGTFGDRHAPSSADHSGNGGAFDLTPVGLRIGGKWAAWAELGIGADGQRAGVTRRF